MRSKKIKSAIVLLCIFMIIAYISAFFLPHTHACLGSDCTACALIEISRNTMIGLVLVAAVRQLINIVFAIANSYKAMLLVNGNTLVALKVKLSD